MAEFARWQWDDNGFWRDFGETQQVEVEAAFQQKQTACDISVPPFGTFCIDLVQMTQRARSGRGAGFERRIRRQVKKIELGYFLLGEEGEVYASDSQVDQIEDLPVIDKLVEVLDKIIAEPEDFERRSINLSAPDIKDNVGKCENAQDFLNSKGFEVISEGPGRTFMIFMHEDVEPLGAALTEAEAARDRLVKRRERPKVAHCKAPLEVPDALPSNEPVSNELPNNDLQELKPLIDSTHRSGGRDGKGRRSKGKGRHNGARTRPEKIWKVNGRLWRVKPTQDEATNRFAMQPDYARSTSMDSDLARSSSLVSQAAMKQDPTSLYVALALGDNQRCHVMLLEGGSLDDLLQHAKAVNDGVRLPKLYVEGNKGNRKPLGLAAEPGRTLQEVAKLCNNDVVVVEDFEGGFVEKLQSGMLTLEELALVAPLLDWEKPELPKLVLNRIKMLLEESDPANAWCENAGVELAEELRFGKALIRRLYGNQSFGERLEVCRRLLPIEVREKAEVQVDRANFMETALHDIAKLSPKQLKGQFVVKFAGERGEDHGGPRRDFFASFGEKLETDLPGLWRRMGKGALAPVPDMAAEASPISQRSNMDRVDECYRACGRVFALAAKHGDVLGEEIASFFVHQVSRDHVVELQQLQQELAECDGEDIRTGNLIRTTSIADCGLKGQKLTRVISGTKTEVELVPGGRDKEVTDENKIEWLTLHLKSKLYDCLQKSCDAFRDGLIDVFGGSRGTCPWLVLADPAELAGLWAGQAVGEEGVARWKEVATVSEDVQQQAAWFWELLLELDEDVRGKILKFCTGTPRFGRVGLKNFQITPADGDDTTLPHAMTCGNLLQLPRYTSKDVLEKQLCKAIEWGSGFDIL